MDPDAALAEISELINLYWKEGDRNLSVHMASSIIDKFEDLDEWIRNGGFLPVAWSLRSKVIAK